MLLSFKKEAKNFYVAVLTCRFGRCWALPTGEQHRSSLACPAWTAGLPSRRRLAFARDFFLAATWALQNGGILCSWFFFGNDLGFAKWGNFVLVVSLWQRPGPCETGNLCARGFPLAAAWVFPVRRRDLQTKRIIDIFYRNAIIIIEREPAGENARVDCVKHNILVKFRKSETCGWPG